MQTQYKSPPQVCEKWVEIADYKAHLKIYQTLLLAVLAGLFIAMGAAGYVMMSASLQGELAGLGKFLGASLFPVGLMLVVLCGGELFTGNNLIAIGFYCNQRLKWHKVLVNWALVLLGNAVGAYFFAFVLAKSGILSASAQAYAVNIASSKVTLTFMQAVLRGFMCNLLVSLAVWMQTSAEDTAGKIFAMFFPVLLFVVCGYEHSVANLFYIPLGQLFGANVSFGAMWLKNILPVALGNILSGGVFVPLMYHTVYLRNKLKKEA
jgi:formate/nitrite transporter